MDTLTTRNATVPRGIWMGEGINAGVIAGAVLANLFILLICLYVIFNSFHSTRDLAGIVGAYFLIGQIFGTLPAISIGLICGATTGYLFFELEKAGRLTSGRREGFWITLGFAALIFIVCVGVEENFLSELLQLYFQLSVGTIALFFLVSGIWGGRRLARKLRK